MTVKRRFWERRVETSCHLLRLTRNLLSSYWVRQTINWITDIKYLNFADWRTPVVLLIKAFAKKRKCWYIEIFPEVQSTFRGKKTLNTCKILATLTYYIGGLGQFMFIENLRRKRLPGFHEEWFHSVTNVRGCMETCAWYTKMLSLSISR